MIRTWFRFLFRPVRESHRIGNIWVFLDGPGTRHCYHTFSCETSTLALRRHVVWRDSVGVRVPNVRAFKTEWAGIFAAELLCFVCCCAVLMSHSGGETAVEGYSPALFWALSVSCWCLQNSFARSTISIAEFNVYVVSVLLIRSWSAWFYRSYVLRHILLRALQSFEVNVRTLIYIVFPLEAYLDLLTMDIEYVFNFSPLLLLMLFAKSLLANKLPRDRMGTVVIIKIQ